VVTALSFSSSERICELTSRKSTSFSPILRARLSIVAPRVGLERDATGYAFLLDDQLAVVLYQDATGGVRVPAREHECRRVCTDRFVLDDLEASGLRTR
jgi:hypothetical protein